MDANPPSTMLRLSGSRALRDIEPRGWTTIDGRGFPPGSLVREWCDSLGTLVDARGRTGESWPPALTAHIRAMAHTVLRFMRPDGSGVFGPAGTLEGRAALLRKLAEVLDDPGLQTVSRWWFGKRRSAVSEGPPPLPALGNLAHPIAMLRADWGKVGDLLAVDARNAVGNLLELMVEGRPVLGPAWPGAAGRGRMRHWSTTSTADCAEWSVGTRASRVLRTAVLLRGRGLALLAEHRVTGGASATSRIALSEGVSTRPIATSRALMLKPAGAGVSVSAVPLALDPNDGGSFQDDGRALSLVTAPNLGAGVWLPILYSWHRDRARKIARWRLLTVSEKGRVCPSDRAFAARVWWGPDDGLVIYRSLTKAVPRIFLGHQTSARFLIGRFSKEGDVRPLLTID